MADLCHRQEGIKYRDIRSINKNHFTRMDRTNVIVVSVFILTSFSKDYKDDLAGRLTFIVIKHKKKKQAGF